MSEQNNTNPTNLQYVQFPTQRNVIGNNQERDSHEFLLPQPQINSQNPAPIVENSHAIDINNNNGNMINNNNANLVPSLENNSVENLSMYNEWLKEFKLICLFSHAFVLLFVLHFLYEIRYIFMFIPLFLWDLYDIFLIMRKIKSGTLSQKMQKRYYLVMFEKYDVILMRIIVIIYVETHWFFVIFALIPLILYTFIRCATYGVEKETGDCHTMIDFLAISFRIFLFIQITTIFCRVDEFITWEWKEVVWSYWVFFSILIGIDFGLVLMSISKLCNCFISNVDWIEFAGLLWFLCISVTFTTVTCIVNIGVSSFLDDGTKELLSQSVYLILASFLANNFLVFTLKKSLCKFLKGINEEEDDDSKSSIKEKSPNAGNSFAIPKFLTKFSSTYFKKADIIETPQIHKTKEKALKPKKKTYDPSVFKSASQLHEKKAQRSNSFHEKMKENAYEINDLNDFKAKKLIFIETNATKPSFNDLGQLLAKEDNLPSTKELRFLSPRLTKIPNLEIVNFKVNNELENKEHVLHTAQLELAENPIKKEEFPRESLKFDIKVGSDGSKFIRNMDLIKSATLPKKFDFLSKSMNISPNKLGLDEIDESSVQNEQNDAVSPQKSNPLDKSLASCLICFDKPPDAVFMDCGHGGACYECAIELSKATGECYLCRKEIKHILQIDLNDCAGEYIRVITATHFENSEKNE